MQDILGVTCLDHCVHKRSFPCFKQVQPQFSLKILVGLEAILSKALRFKVSQSIVAVLGAIRANKRDFCFDTMQFRSLIT